LNRSWKPCVPKYRLNWFSVCGGWRNSSLDTGQWR